MGSVGELFDPWVEEPGSTGLGGLAFEHFDHGFSRFCTLVDEDRGVLFELRKPPKRKSAFWLCAPPEAVRVIRPRNIALALLKLDALLQHYYLALLVVEDEEILLWAIQQLYRQRIIQRRQLDRGRKLDRPQRTPNGIELELCGRVRIVIPPYASVPSEPDCRQRPLVLARLVHHHCCRE